MKSKIETEKGDYNLIMNHLPSSWDVRSEWAQNVLDKIKDVLLEERKKLEEVANENNM